MDLLPDTTLVRWFVRVAIVIVVIALIWWLIKRKKYDYVGIDSKVSDRPFLEQLVKFFNAGADAVSGVKKKKRFKFNKTEHKCRIIMEKIYKRPFPSIRPDFLRSPTTNKNLELDCYNKDLKIAVEYNGRQHYAYTPHFHKSKTDFYSQVHRDDWKRKKCKELGIKLIEVPYWIVDVNLEDFIRKELKKQECL
jgi:hypothetical protein